MHILVGTLCTMVPEFKCTVQSHWFLKCTKVPGEWQVGLRPSLLVVTPRGEGVCTCAYVAYFFARILPEGRASLIFTKAQQGLVVLRTS